MTAPEGAADPQHGGLQAVDAAARHGVRHLFTLSGAHIFPLYDAAVGGAASVQAAAEGPLRLIDVRHEQTAVFAAEAMGKLTRTPGFAAVTAGPGVTNAVSGIIVVGGLLATGSGELTTATAVAIAAVAFATINIAGGFWVTRRMLAMFRK